MSIPDTKYLKEINEKFSSGKALTDSELNDLSLYYDILNSFSEVLGREFGLFQKEIQIVNKKLKSFIQERKI